MNAAKIDIIVPVYNSPEWVRPCLRSIAQNTDIVYRLIVVDDASDDYTRKQVDLLLRDHENSLLIVHEKNVGFVQACNIGMRASESSYLVLLNSDAIVPPGWLSRLVTCAESDPRIGIVNPLSNEAANISIPLAPGCNFLGMDEGLFGRSQPKYPDVVTAIGFGLLLRKAMLDEIGLFDEIYGFGYCEETDLCLRAMKAGWRVVLCDNVYVFHRGNGSFNDRDERYRKNVRIFLGRYGTEYRQAYRQFLETSPLKQLRLQVTEEPQRQWQRLVSTSQVIAKDLAGGHPLRAWRHFKEGRITPQFTDRAERYRRFWRENKPTVTFLFESLGSYGGVTSVLRLVNGLIAKGFEVRIASLNSGAGIIPGLYTQPLYFRSVDKLIDGIAESDVFVSTFWLTAYWLPMLRKRFPCSFYVSYLQDYESWFEPNSAEWSSQVLGSYDLPDTIITTSDWLHSKLLEVGWDSFVIPKGIDTDIFRLMDREDRDPLGVLAMARPHTPYRGYQNLVKIFRLLRAREPNVKLAVFGCKDRSLGGLDFPVHNYGEVANGQKLAQIYNRHTLLVDPSTFQGFGLIGLEAMACGCSCVLTNVGGINEYARDARNAILFNPDDTLSAVDAIQELLRDSSLRSEMVQQGLKTAADFSLQREIDAFAKFFQDAFKFGVANPVASVGTEKGQRINLAGTEI